ncbi:hypothetical protein EE612_044314, partial [Oryza sativa]
TLICQPELQIKLGHGRSPRAQNRAPRSSKHIPPSSHLLTGHRPASQPAGRGPTRRPPPPPPATP